MIAEPAPIPSEIAVRRSDPIYMAHGYLTKVPVEAIIPFLEAFTKPGDTVLDPFAGSGMTGVACAMTCRRGRLSDISVLGRHVGTNYVNLVDSFAFRDATAGTIREARGYVPGIYSVPCSRCGGTGELVKATWSQEYACLHCGHSFTYYRALEAANWRPVLACPRCHHSLRRMKLRRTGETMVLESIDCRCSRKQLDQEPSDGEPPRFPDLECWPDVPIDADREMFSRSALRKHGLTSTAAFFSQRNLTALVALRDAIERHSDGAIRQKLMFAFTAILPRASKRYQWSRQRPLNAQNQTYYVSSVFYEWNVFDLFRRKTEAAIASDDVIRGNGPLFPVEVDVTYCTASAHRLSHIGTETIDYVFTDPPFGSNIFYSDMSLFQEAWLGALTDRQFEAVVATQARSDSTAQRYETLLTEALKECARVLKAGGWLSMVFSNSRGEMWGIAQRALKQSGLELVPERLSSIDKGQRSVKGLASGWEDTVTTDLVFTARKPPAGTAAPHLVAPEESLEESVRSVLQTGSANDLSTPSRLYLHVIRRYLEHHWDLEPLHFGDVIDTLGALDCTVDAESGRLHLPIAPAATRATEE